ncbi:hypothetical protein RR46_13588 [Papilio xuthus]|uniref:Uncharacterized protein n=1 Tax=Papilio xuthus TaxID=66420 RepID=A0A194PGD7_PAPXU|nr:hypothetical protein RR46_13588 [Papilio xuthus]
MLVIQAGRLIDRGWSAIGDIGHFLHALASRPGGAGALAARPRTPRQPRTSRSSCEACRELQWPGAITAVTTLESHHGRRSHRRKLAYVRAMAA